MSSAHARSQLVQLWSSEKRPFEPSRPLDRIHPAKAGMPCERGFLAYYRRLFDPLLVAARRATAVKCDRLAHGSGVKPQYRSRDPTWRFREFLNC